jgi:ketosteroid isomerase-like protein
MRWTAFFIILMCTITPLAQDDADAAVRSKVVALEKAWNQAYKLRDTRALSALLDSSLILVEDDGSLKTRAEFLTSVKLASSNEEQVAPESLSVHVFGKTAIAVGVIATKGTRGGKPFVQRERFVDTWVNRGDSWVCVATNATPILQ